MKAQSSRKPIARDRCGAKTRKGGSCQRCPIRGRRRCRLHGGCTPAGPDSANWKHGLFSRHAPAALRDRIREAAADRALLDLRGDIAFVTGLIAYRLGKLKATRRTPDAADESALITLTDARVRAIDRHVRIELATAETITVAQFNRIASVVVNSVRLHAGEGAARRVQADVRTAVAAEGYRHGDDAT